MPHWQFIRIEASAGVPIARQIVEQIRTQCASGLLRGGDRLPSVREMARELTVNQNTVLRAYERLTADGLIERRHGDGTYVVDRLPSGQLKAQKQILKEQMTRFVRHALALGIESDQLHIQLDRAIAHERRRSAEPVQTFETES